jgi:hypothetical protein
MNKLGKEIVNYQIASLLYSTLAHNEPQPINLEWCETQAGNHLVYGENQTKISTRK